MKRLLLLLATALPLISSCIRTKTVQVPVPIKPVPCAIAATPDSAFPMEGNDGGQNGCPEGYICITIPSAIATGLFIRDTDRVFADLKGCPYVKVDPDAFGTALSKWLRDGGL